MKKLSQILFSVIFSLSLSQYCLSKEKILGKAKIIDGDTIKINSKKIRLFGIDAPEKKQKCKKIFLSISFLNFQKNYNCGNLSTIKLKKKIGNNQIMCVTNSKDRYKRYIGVCYLDKIDLNKWMVTNGYAIAYKKYSRKYEIQEQYAKENKLGIWKGSFVEPEKWRRKNN